MALNTWLGGAKTYPQVTKTTVTSSANTETFTILLRDPRGGNLLSDVTIASYTAGGTETTTTIVTELHSLLTTGATAGAGGGGTGTAANWQHPLNRILDWSKSTNVLTATAKTSGTPFFFTTGGTGTAAETTTQINEGPNDWDCPGNWSLAVAPVDTDEVLIQGSIPILWPSRATLAALADLKVTGSVQMGYPGIPLRVDADKILIDSTAPLHLETIGSAVNPLRVINGNPSFYWQNVNNTNVILEGGDTEFRGINDNTSTDVYIEPSASLTVYAGICTNIYVAAGGRLYWRQEAGDAIAILVNNGGEVETQGASAVTAMTTNAGLTNSNATGTVGILNANGGLTDFTQNIEARTVGTPNLRGGAVRYGSHITFTNDIELTTTEPYELRKVG